MVRNLKCLALVSVPVLAIAAPIPSANQLSWQANEIGVIIHFNMVRFTDV
jgi:hypothetical protein